MDIIGIVSKDSFDMEDSSSSIRKFCKFPSVWFWLYLYMGFKCIDNFKFGSRYILFPLSSMRVPSLFEKNMKDWRWKLRVIQDILKILIQTRVSLVQGCGGLEEFGV